MKKILIGCLAGVALLCLGLIRGKVLEPQDKAPFAETISTVDVLSKAQAVAQTVRTDPSRISMDELDERIVELDRVIEDSNMIAKLNSDDLSDEIRTEFYQVIEAKQALLNEKVRQELARSQSLLQHR